MKLNLKENITEVLAVIIITMSFVFLIMVLWKPIPADNKDLVNLAVGFIIGTAMSGVIGYYFGTSKKRDTITPEPGQSVTNIQKSIVTDVTDDKN
jgi:hypothetical protein